MAKPVFSLPQLAAFCRRAQWAKKRDFCKALTQNLTQPIAPTCHDVAQTATKGGIALLPSLLPEPVVPLGFGTPCPEMSLGDASSGGGTRTPDTRIMIPLL